MHERNKLDEARHFLSRMTASLNERDALCFELSAFLAASRSVLQYACEEARNKPGGQKWYQDQVTGDTVFGFFKEKRDISIHVEPVIPAKNVNIKVFEVIHLSESISVMRDDKDGDAIDSTTTVLPSPPPIPAPLGSVSFHYTLPDWAGSEDVLALSARYLAALDALVKDGRAKGFLTETR